LREGSHRCSFSPLRRSCSERRPPGARRSASAPVGGAILLVRGRRPDPAATPFGLAIATAIAGYTLIDNTGVTRADPLAYLEAVMVAPAVISAAVVAARSGRPALHAAFRTETILIAPLMLAPYSLVLYALRLAPAAPVAAVRETSVLVVPRSRRRC
jgi:hypothetical protein